MRWPPLRVRPVRSLKPTLERVEPRVLLATFTVSNATDTTAAGSLRWAITQSNATPGSNLIKFHIASSGVQTIQPQTPLPTITVPVTIDGTTEPGYGGKPLVDINGNNANSGIGFDIAAGNTTIKGMQVRAFEDGISLSVAGGDTIEDDFIGTKTLGTVADPNNTGILVQVNSNNNTIADNVITAYIQAIDLDGELSGATNPVTSGNLIIGNLIGLDVTGTQALAVAGQGILVENAPNTTIGGTTAADRNIISNNNEGIRLDPNSDGTLIEGNYIGTDITGEVAMGNYYNDITDFGISNCTIGGTTAGAGNVISASGGDGFNTYSDGGNLLFQGNFIGTDATGTLPLANALNGIYLLLPSGVTIGGTVAAARNVISANGRDGISDQASQVFIQGNDIGTDITGTMPLGNGGDGIYANGGTTIGGTAAQDGNIIANNGYNSTTDRYGITLNFSGNDVLSNSIYNNQVLGLYNTAGTSAQAAPVLTQANSTGNTSAIIGSLTARAGTYTLQFFSTPTLNASGNAEGETLLGTETLTITGTSANFSYNLPVGFAAGSYITATAVDSSGDTSNFSTGIVANSIVPPTLSVTAPTQGVTVGQDVTETFSITNGNSVNVADTGVSFTDAIPAGVAFVSGSTSTGALVTFSKGVASVPLGLLAQGQTVMVSLVLSTSTASLPSFTNTGSVTASFPTVASGTDTASATTVVSPIADLTVAVTGPTSTTTTTGKLAFSATVTNSGPSASTGASLTDTFTIPAGASFSAEAVSQGTVTVSGNVVTANFGTISLGATATLAVVVATTVGGTFASSAGVTSTTADSNMANNSASTSVTVHGLASVSLTPSTTRTNPSKPVTLAALVSVPPGFVAASKSVTFYDGSTALGSATLDASGHASLVVTLHPGNHFFSASYSGDANYPAATSSTTIVHVNDTTYGDYDGDGKTDVAIYDQTASTFYILYSGGGSQVLPFGNPRDVNIPVVGDFDGDGKTDIAIYDQTAATFYILDSHGGSLVQAFGNPKDVNIPVAGDFDADGKTDIAIYDQTAATFFILKSGGGSLVQAFGNPRDVNIPVAGDYDGDGKSDLAIFDQTAATFYVLESAGGSLVQPLGNVTHVNIPVPGDFDGDGKSDLTIYDSTARYLYSLESGGGTRSILIGATGVVNVPLSGDYNGDGQTDVGIYDQTDGTFLALESQGGPTLTMPFGNNKHKNLPV